MFLVNFISQALKLIAYAIFSDKGYVLTILNRCVIIELINIYTYNNTFFIYCF